jgi:hypothetical protein
MDGHVSPRLQLLQIVLHSLLLCAFGLLLLVHLFCSVSYIQYTVATMVNPDDPYYSRKPVPNALIQDVGLTGLTPQEEYLNRERKYSAADGTDIRSHSLKAIKKPGDPYYNRKRVSDAEAHGVGETGLTPQEEYNNRERKFSAADGTDIRSHSLKWIKKPGDPYYNRKKTSDAETAGVADLSTEMTPAEQYEVRERKQSMFQISDDPFAAMTGRHRASIIDSGEVGMAAAATRRRSSAVAPHAAQAAATHHHSGYDGADKLAPIESRPDGAPVNSDAGGSSITAADSHATGSNGHTMFYDRATGREGHDEDIAPHDTSHNAVAV